jgi:2-oxoglutarate ferredoxin oxidoreductase subunit delta
MDKGSSTGTDEQGKRAGASKKARGRVVILSERCKGCGFCVEFCPLNVLVLSARFNAKGYHYPEVADAEKCSGCDLCGTYCPDFAVRGGRTPAKE